MASSEGVQKKKRAWRKPREAVGPGVLLETSSEAKPQKLARISHRESEQKNTPSPKDDEAMETAETQEPEAGGMKESSSSSDGARNWDETQGGLEQKHEEGGGAALPSVSLSSGAPSAATLVEIDGSVLEGVSHGI